MPQTKKKPKSTTQFIMFLMLFITIVVIFFSMYIVWVTKDVSVLITLLPCVFVETAACTTFYFFRRKTEAIINYKLQYGEEFIENTLDDL